MANLWLQKIEYFKDVEVFKKYCLKDLNMKPSLEHHLKNIWERVKLYFIQ